MNSDEIRKYIKVNGHDVLVFLADNERFCNVTQLGDAFGLAGRTFERYLATGHGRSTIDTLAKIAGVPPDRLYEYRPGEGFFATHKLVLDFAGWASPHMRMLYLEAVERWSADRLDDAKAADYAHDPIVAQMDALHQTMLALRDQRVKHLELERRVKAQDGRLDALSERVESAQQQADIAVETIKGHVGWYALGPWARKKAGIYMNDKEAAREANRFLKPMCIARGFEPQKRKVDHDRYVEVNSYPESVLQQWAEDYRRRHSNGGV